MSEHIALEIADKFDELASIMRTHNVPTLPKLHEYGKKATDMLRQQHAEIADLQRLQCDCVEEKLHHQWDGDGERCERCGDKDWFAGPECKPAVKGRACRPEDRAMLATPAGQELVAMLATPAGQELVACAIKELETTADNGLFRASVKRSTREWSKEECAEWALQAIMPGYVNVQDVVDSVHASRREYVEMAHEYRRAAAEIERLASALANKEEECRALGLESGNLTEKARHAGIAPLSDNEIESIADEHIYEEDGWNRDRYYHGLNLIAFANAIGHLSVRAFLSLSGQYVTNDASRDAAIAAAVAAEREACAVVCESEADKSGGWEKVRLIEVANMLRRNIRAGCRMAIAGRVDLHRDNNRRCTGTADVCT